MSSVRVQIGFSVESPYGQRADTAEGMNEMRQNAAVVEGINSVMNGFGAGRTHFILGAHLEKFIEQAGIDRVQEALGLENNLVEFASHTYGHITVAPISTRPDKVPVTLEALDADLARSVSLLEQTFGSKPAGFQAPLGYSGGLIGHTKILETLKRHGFRYLNSDARSKNGGLYMALVEDGVPRQPFIYSNELVEIPSHGWQDTAFMGNSKTTSAPRRPMSHGEILKSYFELFERAESISDASGAAVYIGLGFHPHEIRQYDPKFEILTRLLEQCSKKGLQVSSFADAAKYVQSE